MRTQDTPDATTNVDTVVVEVSDNVTNEDLELYFESRRGGDGSLKNISRDKDDDNIAYITFNSCTDAVRIAKMNHKLRGNSLQVNLYTKKEENWKGTSSDRKRQRERPDHTVVVEVSDNVTDEDLELYFESRKGGDGNLKTINRDENNENIAYITFESFEDALRISQMIHKLKGRTLQVELCTKEKKTWKITSPVNSDGSDEEDDEDNTDDDDDAMFVLEVKGVPKNKTEEDLKLYFENRRRSGGKKVEQVEIDRDSGTALVYFVEGNAVETILDKAPFTLDKKKLAVAAYLPSQESKHNSWLSAIRNKTVVKVHNTGDISEEKLEIYFQSKRKSGGVVQQIRTAEVKDVVYLVYETEKEAHVVASRQHTLQDVKLRTTLYHSPKPKDKYKDRFFISGLRESTSRRDLKIFLEEKAGCYSSDIIYGDEPGTALVTLDTSSTPVCLKQLRKIGNRRPLEGAFLHFEEVPISNCILVRNINETTTIETLQDYFESRKSGNDAEIEVEDARETNNEEEALVYFTEHTAISKILKKQHKLEGKFLNVSLYLDCLGAGGGQAKPSWFKIPPVFTLEKEISLEKGFHRFLAGHCETELKKIVHTYRDYGANIVCTEDSLTIKATRDGLKLLKREVEKVVKTIKQDEKAFDHPVIAKMLTSETGDQAINVVEKLERCIIERKVENDDEEEASVEDTLNPYGLKKIATIDVQSKCSLSFWYGDITNLKVDVIVNAANESLDHIGGLAKAVVNKGGLCIQTESTQFVQRNGRVMVGNIAVTDPGNLPCKKIIHAVGPHWNGRRGDAEGLLREAILNCLEEMDKHHFNSIAIPALSTGIYGYPVPDATRVIIGAINDHFRDANSTTITEIHICDTSDETVQNFIDAAKRTFGRSRVKIERFKRATTCPTAQTRRGHSGGNRGGISRIHITIVEGKIAKQKVDVIVNTTNSSLVLMNGAVSKSLVKAGGKTLQRECKEMYPNGVKPGDFAVTSGGKLSCKMVFHTCLPPHLDDQEFTILANLVKACLAEASQKGNQTICFPALGTGNLRYPADRVAHTMYESIEEFDATHEIISLKEVTIILKSKDSVVVEAFQNESSRREAKPIQPVEARRARRATKADVTDDSRQRMDHGDTLFIVGDVMLTIKTGDLTKENVQCIVNSTNANLDLSTGAVSKAITKSGGQYLMDEIDTKRGEMKQLGVTTTSATGLKANYIVHVSADNFRRDWKKVVLACLSEAGQNGIKEIAFPALGTGDDVFDDTFNLTIKQHVLYFAINI